MWPTQKLQDLFNIQHPIFQAPMGGATSPSMTAAVSNEGGFGMVPGISNTPAQLQSTIRETKSKTDKPFGVNVVFKDKIGPLVDVALQEQVSAVSFFWGEPTDYVDQVHAAGSLVIHTVGSVDEAKRSIDNGTDILVAQGWEAGGHVPGNVTSMVLIPAIVDIAGTIPVVAAGGITDGRSIVAAIALGASGVWIGTRFLASDEAPIHPLYRKRLYEAKETGTMHSLLFNKGWECTHRTLRNSTSDAWEQAGRSRAGTRPGETDIVAHKPDGTPIERYTSATPNENLTGDIEALPMWAGQGVHRLNQTQPAAAIFRELLTETRQCLDRF
jgi:nitronate monooxygenase